MNSNDPKQVLISLNPKSGASDRGSLAKELVENLQNSGFEAWIPDSIEQLLELASRLFESGSLRAVVAAGGDGTVSMLINSLPPGIPIAILPLGTENLLAKYLTLEANPGQICKVITDGRHATLDVGKANGKYFTVMASCGFDADVVHRLHSGRKGHIKHSSYFAPILKSIRDYRFPLLRISCDGQTKVIRSKWAFVFNVPRYAMNLPFVEDADPFDGQLDLCTFRGGHLWRGLFYLGGVMLRQHRRWPHSQILRAKSLLIESDDPVKYQLDGDPGGELPLKLEVAPQFLKVLVPLDWQDNKTQTPQFREKR